VLVLLRKVAAPLLQFRLARPITDTWSIEGRAAAWRDLGNGLDTSYKRSLVYIGAIYSN